MEEQKEEQTGDDQPIVSLYMGKPIVVLNPKSKYTPFSMGYAKVGLVLKHYEFLKAWYEKETKMRSAVSATRLKTGG